MCYRSPNTTLCLYLLDTCFNLCTCILKVSSSHCPQEERKFTNNTSMLPLSVLPHLHLPSRPGSQGYSPRPLCWQVRIMVSIWNDNNNYIGLFKIPSSYRYFFEFGNDIHIMRFWLRRKEFMFREFVGWWAWPDHSIVNSAPAIIFGEATPQTRFVPAVSSQAA
jgi:hypothetical protein